MQKHQLFLFLTVFSFFGSIVNVCAQEAQWQAEQNAFSANIFPQENYDEKNPQQAAPQRAATCVVTQVGTAATTAIGYVPVGNSSSARCSYTQTLYIASEIGGTAGYITSIGYYFSSGNLTGADNWTIYIGYTTKTAFSASSNGWETLGNLQQCYSGSVSGSSGNWMTVTLTDPFYWDGESNIIVAVHENNVNYGTAPNWQYSTASGNRCMYYYTTSTFTVPFTGNSISNTPNYPNTRFNICSDPCGEGVQVGKKTGTTTTGYAPVASHSAYSYSQSIYLQSDVVKAGGSMGDVTSISYYWNGTGALSSTEKWDIYIGNTGKTSFGGITNEYWNTVGSMTKVYTGTVSLPSTAGLVNITLQTPFFWDGVSNIVVAVDRNTGTTPGSTNATWVASAAGNYQTIYSYGASDIDPTTVDDGTRTTSLPHIKFKICPSTAPANDLCANATVLTCGAISQGRTTGTVAETNSDASSYGVWYRFTGNGKLTTIQVAQGGLPFDAKIVIYSGACGSLVKVGERNASSLTNAPETYTFQPTNGVTYYVYVASASNSSSPLTGTFNITLLCDPCSDGVIVGTEGNVNYVVPIYAGYTFNYTQTIYTASEIKAAGGTTTGGRITSIAYYWDGTGSISGGVLWDIYIGHVSSKNSFSSTGDWIPVGNMYKVFSGNVALPVSAGWMTINLTTPYLWNGTDNIVVAVDENTNSYTASYAGWLSTYGANRSIYKYCTDNISPSNPTAATGTCTTNIYSYYPNIKFKICPIVDPCTVGVEVGSGTGTLNMVPISNASGSDYNFTQAIYEATDIRTASGYNLTGGEIKSIAYHRSGSSGNLTNAGTWTVYIGPTTLTQFSAANYTGWITTGMQQVYSGSVTLPASGAWMNIDLTTPFVWDGTSNLVVTVHETVGGIGSSPSWYSTASSVTRRSLYKQSANPIAVPSGNSTTDAPSSSSGSSPDIRFKICEVCNAPPTVSYTSLTPWGATITWTAPSPVPANGYDIFINTTNSTVGATPTATVAAGVTSWLYNGGDPNTQYYVWVRSKCSSTASSAWVPVSFKTLVADPCLDGVKVGTGTNDANNCYVPVWVNWGYTYSQTIYTKADIVGGSEGKINTIYYYWTGTGVFGTYAKNWTVYIGHTSKSTFSSTSNWEPVSNLKQVFSGIVLQPASAGWIAIDISANPFVWDGIQNIVVAVYDSDGGYATGTLSQSYWRSTPTTNRVLYCGTEATPINASSPPTGTLGTYSPNIRLSICPACPKPLSLTVGSTVTSNGATISWTAPSPAPSNGYDIFINTTGTAPLPADAPTAHIAAGTTSYPHSGNPNTTYYVWVRSDCGSNDYSNWVPLPSYKTLVACTTPTALTVNPSSTTATVTWTKSGTETAWILEYSDNSSFSPIIGSAINVSTNPTHTLTNLTPGKLYYVRVKANCGSGNESGYTSTSFTTTCAPITALTVNPTSTTATVTWTKGSAETEWLVEYSLYSNFSTIIGSAISVYTTPTCTLPSLTPGTQYYVRVKAVCGSTSSSWVDTPFTTTCPPITALTVTPSSTTATVTWTKGSAETAWILEYSLSSTFSTIIGSAINVSPTPTHTLTNLTPGTLYYVRVRANCGANPSTWESTSFTTVCAAPTALTVNPITSTEATFSWAAGGVTNWIVEYSLNKDFTTIIGSSINVSTTPSYKFENLDEGTVYYVRVKADCGAVKSDWVNASFTTYCDTPTVLTSLNENFSTWLTDCWRTEYPYSTNTISYPIDYMGSNLGGWYQASAGTSAHFAAGFMENGDEGYLISPPIDIDAKSCKLVFNVKEWGEKISMLPPKSGVELYVEISIDGGLTYSPMTGLTGNILTAISGHNVSSSDIFKTFEVSLLPYKDEEIYIRFRGVSDGGYYSILIENVSIQKPYKAILNTAANTSCNGDGFVTETCDNPINLPAAICIACGDWQHEGWSEVTIAKTSSMPESLVLPQILGFQSSDITYYAVYKNIQTNEYTTDPDCTNQGVGTGLDNPQDASIILYPNPAQDIVNIGLFGLGKAKAEITDLLGKTIEKFNINSGDALLQINVSNYASGTYLVRIISDNKNFVERLVVKK